jgi:hypothetical protein
MHLKRFRNYARRLGQQCGTLGDFYRIPKRLAGDGVDIGFDAACDPGIRNAA